MRREATRAGLRRRAAAAALAALALVGAALLLPRPAAAQAVLMDRGVRVNGLWCFPVTTDSLDYVYLPAGARLAQDDQGRPQFSFVRYVVNAAADSAHAATITEAKGGGILHFLVEMDTPASQVSDAEKELKEQLKQDQARIRGPIVFADGRYTLVSSVLREGNTAPDREVIATGRAPVLEGDRIALSFDLDPEHASLLMKSFEMHTPDISIVFDMTFDGLSEAYDAELTIDWSEVHNTQGFNAGASYYFVSADVELAFDEMFKNHAIKLKSSGSDASTEALLTTVYNKLLELMFQPVEPERIPPDKKGGFLDALSTMMGPNGPLKSGRGIGFGASVGYQLKEMKSSGTSVLDFDHRSNVDRHSFVTFNIGDLYRKYGADARFFRAVNLGDPTFQQREVHVAVDAALVPDFDKYVNTVTVTLRKDHENGEQTLQEVVLDRASVKSGTADPRLVYGWSGDKDRVAWLDYTYRTRWSFKGGGTFETDWVKSNAPMIDLFAPYEHRSVQLVGDTATLKTRGVRAVVVQIDYPFFGEQRRPQLVLKPGEPVEDKQVEITQPLGQPDYDYVVTWQLEGDRRLTSRGHDTSGLIFVDEIPGN